MSQRAWRGLHYFGYAVWGLALLHGIAAGTDSRSYPAIATYAGCRLDRRRRRLVALDGAAEPGQGAGMRPPVTVVGNGVSGFACARRLAEHDVPVTLLGPGLPCDRPPLTKHALAVGRAAPAWRTPTRFATSGSPRSTAWRPATTRRRERSP